MYYSDDPAADYDRYCYEQEKELEQLPTCDECGEKITTDFLYQIGNNVFCENCIEEFKTAVVNYGC